MVDTVEVVYALPETQRLIQIPYATGMTVAEALEESGILKVFPEIDPTAAKVGVFGRPCRLDRKLKAGDRVEIYRPLTMDPKEARRYRIN
ncbi:RnfH family protein [Methylohalobius crimeensis]|uniref:RnfH family protein n=1 Tax=Methylohalobius crimeensis TaxID=244365 RepID=UPI0003B5BCC5|nr:RnfH family protein [Methylohalobius crimeensis]